MPYNTACFVNYLIVCINSLLIIVGIHPFPRGCLKFSDKLQKLANFQKREENWADWGQVGVKYFREGRRVADIWRCLTSW